MLLKDFYFKILYHSIFVELLPALAECKKNKFLFWFSQIVKYVLCCNKSSVRIFGVINLPMIAPLVLKDFYFKILYHSIFVELPPALAGGKNKFLIWL
jgi:hypothetical protein